MSTYEELGEKEKDKLAMTIGENVEPVIAEMPPIITDPTKIEYVPNINLRDDAINEKAVDEKAIAEQPGLLDDKIGDPVDPSIAWKKQHIAIKHSLGYFNPSYKVIALDQVPEMIKTGIVPKQSDDGKMIRTYSKDGLNKRYGKEIDQSKYRVYYVDLGLTWSCFDPVVIDNPGGFVEWLPNCNIEQLTVNMLLQLVW